MSAIVLGTPVLGGVSNKQPQVDAFTLPATIIATQTSVIDTKPTPSPAPTPPVYVTTGNITIAPDNPGMVAYENRLFFVQAQNDAIRSAAQNTAAAFGLNVTFSGDRAVFENTKIILGFLNQILTAEYDGKSNTHPDLTGKYFYV